MSQNLNQNDDDNWYLRDFNKPKSSGSVLANPVLLIAAFGVAILVLLVVLVIVRGKQVADQRMAGNAPGQPAPANAAGWNVRPPGDIAVEARHQRAREAFSSRGPIQGISTDEQQAVSEFLPKLLESFHSDAATSFQALFDLQEFRRRVQSSNVMPFLVRQEFEREFDNWLVIYAPFRTDVTRLQIATIQREPSGPMILAYVWVFRGEYPERAVLHLKSDNGTLRLVDFEHLEDAALLSNLTARKFSAAFEDIPARNLERSVEARRKIAEREENFDQQKQLLRSISDLEFPSLLANLERQRIAATALDLGDFELFLRLADRIEQGESAPVIKWYRAIHAMTMKDYTRAQQMLDEFAALLGEGLDVLRLRAEIAEAQEDTVLAKECWLQLLVTDPEGILSWDFHKSMGAEDATRLAEEVREFRDSEIRAASVALQLVNHDRLDLAEALIPIAELVETPTAALFELRAAVNEQEGDNESRLKNLQQAWSAQTTDASSRLRLFNLYAIALQEQERGDEAIRISDDPGMTFQMLSIDDYGYLTVSLPEFTKYLETLEAATATTDEAEANLELWTRLAPAILANELQDYEKAWTLITEILTPDPGSESSEMLELLEEREYRWLADDYLVKAAVRLGRIAEGWKLHSPEFRMRAFLWQLNENDVTAETFRLVAELAKQDPGTDARDLQYFEAMALRQEQKVDECRKILCAIQKDKNEIPFVSNYHSSSSLLKLLLETKDVRPLLSELPPEFAASQLVNSLMNKDRLAEAQAVVDFASSLPEPPSGITLPRLALMAKKKDWAPLCLEGTKALQTPVASTSELAWTEISQFEHFFQAFVETGDFEHAQAIIDRVGDNWKAKSWKFQLALGRNDLPAAETEMTDSEYGTLPDAGFLFDHLQSDEWREFRMRHPMPLSQIIQTHFYLPSSLLLTSKPPGLTEESITTLFSTVAPDVQVKNCTEVLSRAEASGRDQLMSQTQAGPSANAGVTARQCFLVRIGEFTFLLLASDKPMEGPGGRFPEPAIRLFDGNKAARKDAEAALVSHQGWIDVKLFSATEGPAFSEATKLQSRLLATLMTDAATLIVGAGDVFAVNDETRSAFQTVQSESLKPAATARLTDSVGLYKALASRSGVAVHTLCRRLRSQPEGQTSRIQLLVVLDGSSGHDDLAVLLPLSEWSVNGKMKRFVVDSTDCQFIPEKRRGEPIQIFEWQIIGWTEENP